MNNLGVFFCGIKTLEKFRASTNMTFLPSFSSFTEIRCPWKEVCKLHRIFHPLNFPRRPLRSRHARTLGPLTLPFWKAPEQVDFPFPNTKTERQKATSELNDFSPLLGLSGLAGSEGARRERETDLRVKDIKSEIKEREREIGFPFLFPLWAVGRAVWIAMLIGSWKYEEITQNPLDFLTPTWVGP